MEIVTAATAECKWKEIIQNINRIVNCLLKLKIEPSVYPNFNQPESYKFILYIIFFVHVTVINHIEDLRFKALHVVCYELFIIFLVKFLDYSLCHLPMVINNNVYLRLKGLVGHLIELFRKRQSIFHTDLSWIHCIFFVWKTLCWILEDWIIILEVNYPVDLLKT